MKFKCPSLPSKSSKREISTKPRGTFWENIMQIRTLTRISYFLVFISSAFAINAQIVEFATFTVCFVGLFAGYLKNEKTIEVNQKITSEEGLKSALNYFVQLIAVITFLSLTENIIFTAIFALVLICQTGRSFLARKLQGANTKFSIILLFIVFKILIIEFIAMALLGAFSQIRNVDNLAPYYIVSVFGFSTALFFFAAKMVENSQIFRAFGWFSEKQVFKKKDNKTVIRPCNFFRCYAFLFFFGSMLPITLAYFQKVQGVFFLYVIPLVLGFKLSDAMLKTKEQNDGNDNGKGQKLLTLLTNEDLKDAVLVQTLKIVALTGLINIAIGVFAR